MRRTSGPPAAHGMRAGPGSSTAGHLTPCRTSCAHFARASKTPATFEDENVAIEIPLGRGSILSALRAGGRISSPIDRNDRSVRRPTVAFAAKTATTTTPTVFIVAQDLEATRLSAVSLSMSLVIVFPSHQTSLVERNRRILARAVRPASAASGPPARTRRSARRPAVRSARSRSESRLTASRAMSGFRARRAGRDRHTPCQSMRRFSCSGEWSCG